MFKPWFNEGKIEMKSWIDSLVLRKRRRELDELVSRIVARSNNSVWHRVLDPCMHMSPAEARGYVRARAAGFVERETDIATSRRQLSSDDLQFVFDRSLEGVVVATLLRLRDAHLNAPAVLRRAA